MNKYLDIEIKKFIESYPYFAIISESESEIILEGKYHLAAIYQNFPLEEDYELKLVIPNNFPESLPHVLEKSKIINYRHAYVNGELCLAVDMEAYLKLQNNPNLISFFENLVMPSLYSYKFFKETGEMPFGERSHGVEGALEFLKDYFCTNDLMSAGKLLVYVIDNTQYRGHLPCPCGSGIITRKCHGNQLKELFEHRGEKAFQLILNRDFQEIAKYVKSKNRR